MKAEKALLEYLAEHREQKLWDMPRDIQLIRYGMWLAHKETRESEEKEMSKVFDYLEAEQDQKSEE